MHFKGCCVQCWGEWFVQKVFVLIIHVVSKNGSCVVVPGNCRYISRNGWCKDGCSHLEVHFEKSLVDFLWPKKTLPSRTLQRDALCAAVGVENGHWHSQAGISLSITTVFVWLQSAWYGCVNLPRDKSVNMTWLIQSHFVMMFWFTHDNVLYCNRVEVSRLRRLMKRAKTSKMKKLNAIRARVSKIGWPSTVAWLNR